MKHWISALGLSLGLLAGAQASTHAAALPDFVDLVEQQSPSVVNITTTQDKRPGAAHPRIPNMPKDEMFEFFRRFMPPEGETPRNMPPRRGQGSGFIISADGYILTNTHVIDDVDEVTVKLNDKREFTAKVIGSDDRTDIALLKIEARNLPKVIIGDPNRLRVGEWVLAIGAPFGFENSATAGIVSAKGRALPDENYVPFIQTDVAVNPGNSGGPLFNLRGEVVGVNSQIISRSGGYMGLSFAIPIDVAMDVAKQIRDSGKVNRGRLGVLIQEVTADLADTFGLKEPRGALVAEVEPGSPADKAGLKPSDIIVKFDGRDVPNSIELPRMVGATAPGTRATLGVWRKGKMHDIAITVGEMPQDKQAGESPKKRVANKAGLVVAKLPAEKKRDLKIDSGVLVEEATGAAARAGLRPEDIIVSVDGEPVNSADELSRAINDNDKKSFALLVKRGEGSIYIPLKIK
jgi:serine protease Do